VYYDGNITVGVILYNDIGLTIPFTYSSSNPMYYLIDGLYICKVRQTDGYIMSVNSQLCDAPGGGCCLLSGTEILLNNGDVKNIEDIVIGDEVITYDFNNDYNVSGIVTKLFSPIHNDIIKILLSNGFVLDCTSTHPIWCVSKNSWVSLNPLETLKSMSIDIQNLSINDVLLSIDNCYVFVVDIIEIDSEYITTYDISVIPNNNYYANDILVHNKIDPNDPNGNGGGG
jgi:hypothetical protein